MLHKRWQNQRCVHKYFFYWWLTYKCRVVWSGLCCGSGCEGMNQKHTQSMILTRHQVNLNQLELWIITKNTNCSVNITFTDRNTNHNVRLRECLTETAKKSNYALTTCILIQVQNQSGETYLLVPLNTCQRKTILCLTFFLLFFIQRVCGQCYTQFNWTRIWKMQFAVYVPDTSGLEIRSRSSNLVWLDRKQGCNFTQRR